MEDYKEIKKLKENIQELNALIKSLLKYKQKLMTKIVRIDNYCQIKKKRVGYKKTICYKTFGKRLSDISETEYYDLKKLLKSLNFKEN